MLKILHYRVLRTKHPIAPQTPCFKDAPLYFDPPLENPVGVQ